MKRRAPAGRACPAGLVHATAIVDPGARLGPGVAVGPYAVIEPEVMLGRGCVVHSHAVIGGPAEIGAGTRIHPYAVVGTDPQDHKWKGERTIARIGARCEIREFATINRGTGRGGGETVVMDDSYVMAHAHVAHDCRLGSHVVIANMCSLAGHVVVDDHVVFGGMSAVSQYVRIGRCAFVAAGAMLERDLPPFGIAAGDRARLAGVNLVGMRRLGLSDEARRAIKGAYAILLRKGVAFRLALREIEASWGVIPEVRAILDFIGDSRTGIVPPG